MEIAIVSDIHGNLSALLEVLRDAGKRGIDRFIFAGDYCLSGAWPDECIKVLRDISHKKIVRGNEERYLENLIGKDQSTWTDGQMQISYWNYRNIRKDNLEAMFSWPERLEFAENGVKIHVAHSSDLFLGEYEFGKIGPGILAERYKDSEVTPDILRHDISEILDHDPVFQKRISGLEEGVYIFGHSHVQWSYGSPERNVLLINPGSCGLPLDAIMDSIPYSILSITENGETKLEEIRLPFSKQEYVETLKKTSQYAEAKVWSEVIIKELLTAREHLVFFLNFAEKYAQEIGDAERPFKVSTWEDAFNAWERGMKQNLVRRR